MTVVVEAALEAYEANLPPKFRPEPTPEEAAETYRILCEFAEAFSARKEPGESSDHSYLYDEKGLPI